MTDTIVNMLAWRIRRDQKRERKRPLRVVFGFDYVVDLETLEHVGKAWAEAGRSDIARHIAENAVVVVEDDDSEK